MACVGLGTGNLGLGIWDWGGRESEGRRQEAEGGRAGAILHTNTSAYCLLTSDFLPIYSTASALTGSPVARVVIAASVFASISGVSSFTWPSAKVKLAPAGWWAWTPQWVQ